MGRTIVDVRKAMLNAGGMQLPVLHVVMDTDGQSGGATDAELAAEIYNRAAGMTAACAVWSRPSGIPELASIPNGYTEYNGPISVQAEKRNDNRGLSPIRIIISDPVTTICRSYAFTGYGMYEYSFLTVYTDRNNRVYDTSQIENGLYVLSTIPFDYTPLYSAVVESTVMPGWSLYDGIDIPVSLTLIDISDYLTDVASDPYAPGGIAEPGGGDGTFDWESDPVPVQPLPEISITDAGFVNLYVPTKAQLQNLCRYLWSSAFDIESLKRIFLEPMDVIIGLSILPVTPEEVDAELSEILVGQYSSGISCYEAHRQYVQVDCGTVSIEPKWGAYLDFSPYSKLQLYLPYIGFVDITPDDCMNGTVHVVYNIDILSGSCLAQIECTTPGKDGELNSHVLYEYTGNCAVECPVTSGQYRNIISSMFTIASGVIETATTHNPTSLITGAIDTVKGITKPMVSRAGGPGKNAGILGHQAPYLVLTCPRMIIPGQQNAMIGYPSYVTLNLGDLNGYTQIDTIHLAGVPASKDEQDEIVDLLQKGVFL